MTSDQAGGILHETSGGVELRVTVIPRSSQSRIMGIHDGALKIKLTKSPVDGRANAECCKVIAKQLGIPGSRVQVVHGPASRHKTLSIEGLSRQQVHTRLGLLRPAGQ